MPPPAEDQELAGCGVMLTRPAGYNQVLNQALQALGARVFELPLLCIEACPQQDAASHSDNQAHGFIFTSRNAVKFAFAQWPQLARRAVAARFYAVGAGTAAALRARGVTEVLVPREQHSSEGLLALSEFQQPAGQQLVIITGAGGRSLLADTLRSRGAVVRCLEVYRRLPTGADVNHYLHRHGRAVNLIVITSGEALRVLIERGDGDSHTAVTEYPLVVASARIAAAAEQSGFVAPLEIIQQVSDAALLEGCRRLWRLIRQ